MNIRGSQRSLFCWAACSGLLISFPWFSTLAGQETAGPNVGTNVAAPFTGTVGWEFVHSGPHYHIYLTRLGVYDAGGDGLVNAHQVGLWTSTGSLLISATVPPGTDAPLENGYRYVSVDPVALMPAHYVIAAQFSAGDADLQRAGPATGLGPELNFPDFQLTRYAAGLNFPFPTNQTGAPQCEGCGPTVAWVANFQYFLVPPPPKPPIRITRSSGTLAITWPTSATNFVLESTANVSPSSSWQLVTNSIQVIDGQFSVSINHALRSEFLRLRWIPGN